MAQINNKIYHCDVSGHNAVVEEYDPSTMVIHTLSPDMELSQDQISMLEKADQYPIVFEDDCPETTPEMAEAFKKAAMMRDIHKQIVQSVF